MIVSHLSISLLSIQVCPYGLIQQQLGVHQLV